MLCYNKTDILELLNSDEKIIMPHALFDTMQYKLVRLEVKWAYVACLNVLVKEALYHDDLAYIREDNDQIKEALKEIAHKKVDQEKINGYLDELEEYGLIERTNGDVYLKKMMNIF